MADPGEGLDEQESSEETTVPSRTVVMRALAVVPALLLVVVAGRGLLVAEEESRHADGEGILSVNGGPGAVAFARIADEPNSWGTFGSYLLCLGDDAEDVVLTDLRLESTIAPRTAYAVIRTLTPEQVGKAVRGDDPVAPIETERGRPPEFRRNGGGEQLAGSFRRGVEGVTVETACDDVAEFGSREMAAPMQELLVVAKPGPRGAYISAVEIDYEADGEAYTLRLDSDLAFCGPRVTVCEAT